MLLPDAGKFQRRILGDTLLNILDVVRVEFARRSAREGHEIGVIVIAER